MENETYGGCPKHKGESMLDCSQCAIENNSDKPLLSFNEHSANFAKRMLDKNKLNSTLTQTKNELLAAGKNKFIKLFRPGGEYKACAQIYINNYECSLEHVMTLANELKRDFGVTDSNLITIQKYGGNKLKGIIFVEIFLSSNTAMPEGYEEIKDLEYIL